MNLVTLKQVKRHVNQDTSFDDKLLEEKRFQASAIILDYLKMDTSDTGFDWVDELGEPTNNIPGVVTAATLLVVGSLYENRDGSTSGAPQALSQTVIDLLMRSRDLTMS
jgi:hypothetical protein